MKFKILFVLMMFSLESTAAQSVLPSCDLQDQRALAGETGGQFTDVRQAHISARANVLSADIGTSLMVRKISKIDADQMFKTVKKVRLENDSLVVRQGFLSAAEKASFDRQFDAIALQICQ